MKLTEGGLKFYQIGETAEIDGIFGIATEVTSKTGIICHSCAFDRFSDIDKCEHIACCRENRPDGKEVYFKEGIADLTEDELINPASLLEANEYLSDKEAKEFEAKNFKKGNSTFAVIRCSSCGIKNTEANLTLIEGTQHLCDKCYSRQKSIGFSLFV